MDPETVTTNLMVTAGEDSPERILPTMAYEGYNFLPTAYGYRSYFDVTPRININSLTVGGCDYVIVFQRNDYSVRLVALCNDGIYTADPTTASVSWTKSVSMTALSPGTYKQWSFCIIENDLYIYRQAETTVSKLSFAGTFSTITPSFLNMSGQMGIFRANGRLGFWDSANSVSWSSNLDFSDFTPAIETLAGNAIFNDVLGRVVSIRAFGNGFVIYSTKNITGVSYNTSGSMLFSADTIVENAGIWDSKQVCTGVSDEEHYACTNTGIKQIARGFQVKEVFTALYDYLKQSRDPIAVDFIQGRFLFLNVIDTRFITGAVNFNTNLLTALSVRFLLAGGDPITLPTLVDGIPLNDYLTDQALQGSDYGMVAEWTVDGSKMVPAPRTSSISEFQLDDPTTPVDDYPYTNNVTNYYTDAELITARDNATLSSVVSINDSAINNLQLGWTKIPYGSTGTVTAELARLANRQNQEWEEHRDLVTQLQTQISILAHDYVDTWHSGTYYDSSTLANAATPADSPINKTALVTIPWGFTTPVTTITGAGTNSPTFEYKATFTQGLKVSQNKAYSYTIIAHLVGSICGYDVGASEYYDDPVDLNNPHDFPSSSQAVANPSKTVLAYLGLPPGTIEFDFGSFGMFPVTQDVSLGYLEVQYNYGGTPSNCMTLWPTTFSAGQTLVAYPSSTTVENALFPGDSVTLDFHSESDWIYDLNDREPTAYKNIYYKAPGSLPTGWDTTLFPPNSVLVLYRVVICVLWTSGPNVDVQSFSGPTYGMWRIRKTTDTSLVTETEAISTISKATGTQTNLDWGSYLVGGTPPARLTYNTNQQTLNFTGWAAPANAVLPQNASLTFPGATFLLQNGAIAPIYPTYTGAYVYDTVYQKWGKFKGDYKCLVDYAPLNSNHQKVVSFSNFGMDAGTLNSSGYVTLFSSVCSDSYLKYGRLGFYRQGYTYPEVVTCHFARPFTGEIEVEASLDGRSVHAALTESKSFTGVGYANVYPSYAAKWFNFSITGEFDIRNLEFTGRISGRR